MHPTRQAHRGDTEERRAGFETEGPLTATQLHAQRHVGRHRTRGPGELATHLRGDLDVEFEDLDDARLALQRQVHGLGLDLPTRQIHITVHRVDVELTLGLHLDDLHQVGLYLDGGAQGDALAANFNTDLDVHLGDAHQVGPGSALHAEHLGLAVVGDLDPHFGLEDAGEDDLAFDAHQNAGVQGQGGLLVQLHRLHLRGGVQLHAELRVDLQTDGLAQGLTGRHFETERRDHALFGDVDVGIDLNPAERTQGHVAVDAQRELLVCDQEEQVGLDLEASRDGELARGADQDVPAGGLVGAVDVLGRPLDGHGTDGLRDRQAVAIDIELRTAVRVEGGHILDARHLHDLPFLVPQCLEGRVGLGNGEHDIVAEGVDLDQGFDLEAQTIDPRREIAREARGEAELAVPHSQVDQGGHARRELGSAARPDGQPTGGDQGEPVRIDADGETGRQAEHLVAADLEGPDRRDDEHEALGPGHLVDIEVVLRSVFHLHLGVGRDRFQQPDGGVVTIEHIVPALATVGRLHQRFSILGHRERARGLRCVGQLDQLEIAGGQIEGVGGLRLFGGRQPKVDVLVHPGRIEREGEASLQEQAVLLELLQAVPGLDPQSPVHFEPVTMLDHQLAGSRTDDSDRSHLKLGRDLQPELGRCERQRRLAVELHPEGVVCQISTDTTGDDHLEPTGCRHRRSRVHRSLARGRIHVLGPVRVAHLHGLPLGRRGLQRQRIAGDRVGRRRESGTIDGHRGRGVLQDRVIKRNGGGVRSCGEGLRLGLRDVVPGLEHLGGQPISGFVRQSEVQHAIDADAALAPCRLAREVEEEEEPALTLGPRGQVGIEVRVDREAVREDRLARQQDLARDVDLEIHLGAEGLP